jgi:hypothetical protein
VRAQESELPRSIAVSFIDGESPQYRKADAAATRPAGARRRETRVEAAIVTRRDEAEALAEALLDATLAGRDTASLTLSPRRIDLAPGDLLGLPGDANPHRIVRIADGPAGRRMETRAVPLQARRPRAAGRAEAQPRRAVPLLAGRPFAVVLDLPADRGVPTPLQVLAVAADPWPGAVAIWRSAGAGTPLSLHGFADYPACLGQTLTALAPGPLWRFDRANRLDVHLRHAGALGAIDEGQALVGGNLFALVGVDGAVELISAAGITLIGPQTYRLTRLLRGLAGSEGEAARTLPAGCLIVRLDAAVVPLVERLDEAGRAFRYRIGPADRDPGDPAFAELFATAGLLALRPLSPVHLRARREADGVRVTWIRRARRDGDSWDVAEIPLDDPEAYVVEIFADDGRLVRTLTAASPTLLYRTADETADFGRPQASLDLGVAQIGLAAGRGPPCRARTRVTGG